MGMEILVLILFLGDSSTPGAISGTNTTMFKLIETSWFLVQSLRDVFLLHVRHLKVVISE